MMKNLLKRASALLLVFALALTLSVTALAAESTVTYRGQEEGFGFDPGSEYTATDLFDNFKGVMPGDVRTETVTITNKDRSSKYIRVYLRAVPHGEENPLSTNVAAAGETVATMTEFLQQLTMQVYQGDRLIYEATPDQSAQLTESFYLGMLSYNSSMTLEVKLTVPLTLGNEFANRVGEVDWVFTADPWTSPPPTPGTSEPPEEPEEREEITVSKIWDDDGKDRPASVTVTLFNGAHPVDTVTLSAANDWSYHWEELPEGDWTVHETDVPDGYHAIYREKDGVIVITNTRDLIKTGQEFGAIAILGAAGLLLIAAGLMLMRKKKQHG